MYLVLILISLLHFFATKPLNAYVLSAFWIKDLHDIDHSLFLEDVSHWKLSSTVSVNRTEVTQAYNQTSKGMFQAPSRIILGGYNILGPSGQSTMNQYFEREYSGLGPHSFLTFQVIMFFIDDYFRGQSQVMQFNIDNTVVPGTMVDWLPDFWVHEAGSPTVLDVGFVHVRGRVPHSGSSLNFKIVSTTPQSSITAPFGFRELTIHLSSYATDTSISICQTTPEVYPMKYNQCDCQQLNQAKDLTNTCQNCTNNCKHCFGVSNTECYLCNDNAYWTGSGCNPCHSTCATCKGPGNVDCLTCPYGYVDLKNGSCSNKCNSPLTLVTNSEGVSFCDPPCNSSEYYWAANQSCLANCSFPLTSKAVEGPLLLCLTPCSSSSEFVYQDGSCSSSCHPLFEVSNKMVGVKFCNNPCPPEKKFIYPDATCKSTCEYPYTVDGNLTLGICVLDLDSDTIQQVKQLSEASAIGNSVSNGGGMIGSLLSVSDPASMCLGPFAKMLQYIKFMDIRYPPKVQLMLESQNTNSGSLDFLAKPVKKFTDQFKNQTVPGKFSQYKISSSFIVNFWQSILMLLSILFFMAISCVLLKCFSKSSRGYSTINIVVSTLKWNFFMIMYCGTVGDIVLYSALEFQTFSLDDFTSNLSFLVCAGFNVLTVIVIVAMLYVNMRIKKSKSDAAKNRTSEEIEKEWDSFRAFFGTYKDAFFGQQIFLLVFIIRVACFNAIVGYAYDHPLLQTVLIAFINLMMTLYLIIVRPMKAKINFVQQITFELLLLIFNTNICILAVADELESEAFEMRKNIGELIVMLNIIVPLLSTVFIVLKIVLLGIEVYKEFKLKKMKKFDSNIPEIKLFRPDEKIAKTNFPSHNESGILRSNNVSINSTNNSPDLSFSHQAFDSSFTALTLSPSPKKVVKKRKKVLMKKSRPARVDQNQNQNFNLENESKETHQRNRISAFSKEAKMLRRPQYNQKRNLENHNLFGINLGLKT